MRSQRYKNCCNYFVQSIFHQVLALVLYVPQLSYEGVGVDGYSYILLHVSFDLTSMISFSFLFSAFGNITAFVYFKEKGGSFSLKLSGFNCVDNKARI